MSVLDDWPSIEEEEAEEQLAAARAAVEKTRKERGIDRFHDSGSDSGSLSEDEEDERRARGR